MDTSEFNNTLCVSPLISDIFSHLSIINDSLAKLEEAQRVLEATQNDIHINNNRIIALASQQRDILTGIQPPYNELDSAATYASWNQYVSSPKYNPAKPYFQEKHYKMLLCPTNTDLTVCSGAFKVDMHNGSYDFCKIVRDIIQWHKELMSNEAHAHMYGHNEIRAVLFTYNTELKPIYRTHFVLPLTRIIDVP